MREVFRSKLNCELRDELDYLKRLFRVSPAHRQRLSSQTITVDWAPMEARSRHVSAQRGTRNHDDVFIEECFLVPVGDMLFVCGPFTQGETRLGDPHEERSLALRENVS